MTMRDISTKYEDTDHEGTCEYVEAGDIVAAFHAGHLAFHHALRRMNEDFGASEEDALFVLFPPMEDDDE